MRARAPSARAHSSIKRPSVPASTPLTSAILAPCLSLTSPPSFAETCFSASSQPTALPPASGARKRSGLYSPWRPAWPRMQSAPSLRGKSGLPSSLTMRPSRFLATTPQPIPHSRHTVEKYEATPGTMSSGGVT